MNTTVYIYSQVISQDGMTGKRMKRGVNEGRGRRKWVGAFCSIFRQPFVERRVEPTGHGAYGWA